MPCLTKHKGVTMGDGVTYGGNEWLGPNFNMTEAMRKLNPVFRLLNSSGSRCVFCHANSTLQGTEREFLFVQ